ncbi:hypothetical protein CIB84_003213 [Bambusicola thoracicus]|uniref:Poly [ADP-ribose] polymerase n=1 Tax=Bambusicola thoracicus TaxID=9083 RepID=A0A2P4T9J6_BAMTH|nr:hypothetical protein CIB84_003213 [Bambusicola thoracicus]
MAYAWYWLDDLGQWIEYGKEHPIYPHATVNSADLEKAFLADKRGTLVFGAGSQAYELNFKDMVQRNVVYATQRKVMRLPKKLYSQLCIQSHRVHFILQNGTNQHCLKLGTRVTCRSFFVTSQKEHMKKLHKSNWVDERLLFHGTNPSHMPAICEQNFDWRICGTHGTMYGKGSYFARDASYSHAYCSSGISHYSMFVAQVLVGKFVQGDSEYLRPPPTPNNRNRLYDSCVDDPENPSIFVIFEKFQIYPAYILEYSSSSLCVIL